MSKSLRRGFAPLSCYLVAVLFQVAPVACHCQVLPMSRVVDPCLGISECIFFFQLYNCSLYTHFLTFENTVTCLLPHLLACSLAHLLACLLARLLTCICVLP